MSSYNETASERIARENREREERDRKERERLMQLGQWQKQQDEDRQRSR